MKSKNNWREEPYWHWDWPGRPQGYLGTAHGVQDLGHPEPPRGSVAGHLVIPDVEKPTGWREWWVYHDPPESISPNRLGF